MPDIEFGISPQVSSSTPQVHERWFSTTILEESFLARAFDWLEHDASRFPSCEVI
jgi:hypothetical protein